MAGREQPFGSSSDGGHVDGLLLVEDLQIDQVVGALVAARLGIDRRAGVKLLRDLVVERHNRDRARCFETEAAEQLDDVGREAQLGVGGAADLVVAELERHRQPVPVPVGEPDGKGPHHILLGHALRLWGVQLLDRAREAGPSDCEPIRQLLEIVIEGDVRGAGGVHVGSEAAGRLSDAQLHRRSALDHARRQHLADDGVGHGALDASHRTVLFPRQVVDPGLQRP